MISVAEEEYILNRAYVPEHIVSLMALISGGEPFLLQDCLCLAKEGWVILVGYPLTSQPAGGRLQDLISEAVRVFQPEHLWFIAPEVPTPVAAGCQERESDQYYRLELEGFAPKANLRRMVARASGALTVERVRTLEKAHEDLIAEFLDRERPDPRIRNLFLRMPEYAARSSSATVLTARDPRGEVSAFYVVDLGARQFATYVAGCHSKTYYVAGASDLLFSEMVVLARTYGKTYIHLGLGVNEGIRRFKEKWGGVPCLPYEFGAYRPARFPPWLSLSTRVWS